MKEHKCIAVVLAAGRGKRMGSDMPKQYIELDGKPILYYSLRQFEQCSLIDEIILVTGKDEIEFCRQNIVEKYSFNKIKDIVEGGAERYHSVYSALQAIDKCDYVFIHDGARPFIEIKTIEKLYENVKEHQACVVGVKSKDTVKLADEEEVVSATLDRSMVWNIQTPQVFAWTIVKEAYDKLMVTECDGITDDAMVVENMLHHKIKLVEGDYENIKVTTPSDLIIASAFLNSKG
ncbi:2-C-methyl-D-erythritol 4-phosphate cytidylyltransferase [Konateibacter massiliensis]|uniref:2-C-methyl-D-erythritol 4-phosphate cytidylyltransferase n=1 Tax=Konateibacter massiliensis TaxID=2002841 RepID=UPI000C152F3B|nr:2-C-methyl-D-erythritol 4-phosphate cytidylyltransferase [Konateibacter massiliensis]